MSFRVLARRCNPVNGFRGHPWRLFSIRATQRKGSPHEGARNEKKTEYIPRKLRKRPLWGFKACFSANGDQLLGLGLRLSPFLPISVPACPLRNSFPDPTGGTVHCVLHKGFQRRGGVLGTSGTGTITLPDPSAARAKAVTAEQVKIRVQFVLVRPPQWCACWLTSSVLPLAIARCWGRMATRLLVQQVSLPPKLGKNTTTNSSRRRFRPCCRRYFFSVNVLSLTPPDLAPMQTLYAVTLNGQSTTVPHA